VLVRFQIGKDGFVDVVLLSFSMPTQIQTNEPTEAAPEPTGKESEPVDTTNANPTEKETVQDMTDNTFAQATETSTEETKGDQTRCSLVGHSSVFRILKKGY
jgi:hypothetical protein